MERPAARGHIRSSSRFSRPGIRRMVFQLLSYSAMLSHSKKTAEGHCPSAAANVSFRQVMKENDHFFHSKACTCRTCASWSSSCCCCRAASSWRIPFLAAGAAVFVDGCILAPSVPFVKACFSYFFILMQIFSRSLPGIIFQKRPVFSIFTRLTRVFSCHRFTIFLQILSCRNAGFMV